MEWESIIVGGGAAGLSAALVLGRCGRRVIVLDDGSPRNAYSRHLHGFLSRDGINPREFLRIAREQIAAYPSVKFAEDTVSEVKRSGEYFEAATSRAGHYRSPSLLIATGVIDAVPELEGIQSFYGRSVFHCPYCDGWEVRGRRLGVLGCDAATGALAIALLAWSNDIVVFAQDSCSLHDSERERLARNGVSVIDERVVRLIGDAEIGALRAAALASGAEIERDALFFSSPERQHSRLAHALGCEIDRDGGIRTDELESTSVPGVFAAGNVLRDVQLGIIAAAQGARAAFGMNKYLLHKALK